MKNIDKKFTSFITDNKVTCTCGHRIFISPSKNKMLCSYCGHYAYKKESEKFKDILQKMLKEGAC